MAKEKIEDKIVRLEEENRQKDKKLKSYIK